MAGDSGFKITNYPYMAVVRFGFAEGGAGGGAV